MHVEKVVQCHFETVLKCFIASKCKVGVAVVARGSKVAYLMRSSYSQPEMEPKYHRSSVISQQSLVTRYKFNKVEEVLACKLKVFEDYCQLVCAGVIYVPAVTIALIINARAKEFFRIHDDCLYA